MLLNVARDSAAVKVFHGVRDAEIHSGVHSLTNWIACLRNSNARERTLQQCQENRNNNRPKPKQQAQKAPSARREENDVDPILREISFLVSERENFSASSRCDFNFYTMRTATYMREVCFPFPSLIPKPSRLTSNVCYSPLFTCIMHRKHTRHTGRVRSRAPCRGEGSRF